MVMIAEQEFTAQELFGRVQKGWERCIQWKRGGGGGSRPYCYASDWHPCERYLVHKLVDGDKIPPITDPDLLARFQRGNDREHSLMLLLHEVGRHCDPPFQIVGGQERFTLSDRKGREAIVGKVDARLSFGRRGPSIPAEIKSWHPNLVAQMHRFEDLLENRWTRRGAIQLLCYLLGAGEEIGCLILDRPGLPLLLPVELTADNLDLADKFLDMAERALDHKEAGTYPDYLSDPVECKRCDLLGDICNPPLNWGEGIQIITDESLEQDLESRQEILDRSEEDLKTLGRLDKKVKKRLRGVEQGLCGPFSIQGKWGQKTSYDLPDEIKKLHKVVNPKGSFTITIERISEES